MAFVKCLLCKESRIGHWVSNITRMPLRPAKESLCEDRLFSVYGRMNSESTRILCDFTHNLLQNSDTTVPPWTYCVMCALRHFHQGGDQGQLGSGETGK